MNGKIDRVVHKNKTINFLQLYATLDLKENNKILKIKKGDGS